jgi:anaerobic ribonucleoside-triphosphate reductase activating protein
VDSAELLEKIKGNPLLDGVTFSGGEPFMQADALADLAVEIKKLGLNIITYTGFTFEELFENRDKNGWGRLLEMSDYLIDGKFEIDKKDWEIKFRGSSNQRYLDCAASLAQGRAVEIEP